MTDLWHSFSVTDVGMKRNVNQDAIYTSDSDKLWIVADGMGGHAEGDKASKALVKAFENLDLSDFLSERILQIEATICKVNNELQIYSRTTLNGKAIGTTVVLYTVCQGVGVLIWAGDSRGYKVVKNEFKQISWDHSHVEELLKAGQITKEEAAESKLSNVITRAVGAHKDIYFDHVLIPANFDNTILLCSDGLTNELNDVEINTVIQKEKCSQKAIDSLLNKTLDKGAKDNVSIIVIGNQYCENETQEVTSLYSHLNNDASIVSQNFFQGIIERPEYKVQLASILNSCITENISKTPLCITTKDKAIVKYEKELPTKNYPKVRNIDLIKNKISKLANLFIIIALILIASYMFLNYDFILDYINNWM